MQAMCTYKEMLVNKSAEPNYYLYVNLKAQNNTNKLTNTIFEIWKSVYLCYRLSVWSHVFTLKRRTVI
jgi:hypothetical protein